MNKEFTVKALPDTELRTGYISPVELLAITSVIDFKDYVPMRSVYNFALEHVEVKIGDTWKPIKMKDQEVYLPVGLEQNLPAMNEICQWFVNNVCVEVFPKSSE